MGASQLWLKSELAPSPMHRPWKFQHASFKGSGNIKGGVKHTKMDENLVKNFSHSRKSQNKLSRLRANMCENIDSIFLKSTSKCRFEIFRPIGRNANAKFKGAPNFSGEKIWNSPRHDFAYPHPLGMCKISGRSFEELRADLFFWNVPLFRMAPGKKSTTESVIYTPIQLKVLKL